VLGVVSLLSYLFKVIEKRRITMIRNLSTPALVLTLKPSVSIRIDQKLSKLTVALNGLGGRIVNFDDKPKPHGGYEVRIFDGSAEDRVLAIVGDNGFTVSHRRSN
jgi:hypothetical protein